MSTPPFAAHLTESQRSTLGELARCLLQGAPPSSENTPELAVRCDARLSSLAPHKRNELGLAISLLGGRVGVLLAIGRPTPFRSLSDSDQARCFTAWGRSRVPQLRSAFQAVKRLVMAVHYARPEVAAATGYAGPLQSRAASRVGGGDAWHTQRPGARAAGAGGDGPRDRAASGAVGRDAWLRYRG